jgi:catechol-2,3-dioxygenase
MNIHIAVVSLWAENVPATTHFYRDVIGLSIMPPHAVIVRILTWTAAP